MVAGVNIAVPGHVPLTDVPETGTPTKGMPR
ncbi:predicted protein [Streptomyces filamentosus NRRL 15998]|uniref:Predicted protein n=1 Tax=Streptomyces filamentosus NRRL 15998 TaxID=457431 RepID=D6AIU9_STRFL|nr:predicted protein [Streptomyces filamentosus NRRL 15998]